MFFFYYPPPEFNNEQEEEDYYLKETRQPELLDCVSFLRWLDLADPEQLESFAEQIIIPETSTF
jgi:hypothetical protein